MSSLIFSKIKKNQTVVCYTFLCHFKGKWGPRVKVKVRLMMHGRSSVSTVSRELEDTFSVDPIQICFHSCLFKHVSYLKVITSEIIYFEGIPGKPCSAVHAANYVSDQVGHLCSFSVKNYILELLNIMHEC